MNELKTCFKKVDYDLSGLLTYIDIGDIGLPDIQRPFVWSNTKVRDLFDSMYRGFPVGYLLFWENGQGNGVRQIGIDTHQHSVPSRLIVDGQQRLTSLYSVFRGRRVLDKDYNERHIEIAFRPRDGRFEVADAAIRRDPEWISNISDIWASGKSSYQMVKGFLTTLESKNSLSEEEETGISANLDRLFDLMKYPFTALEIAPTVSEEEVADVFVRINSEGVKLNQADFILTLMSVFWDEGRHELERFCRASRQVAGPGKGSSPYNYFIQPDPDQLLRVSVGLGFRRARLQHVYNILRGKDLETGEFSEGRRNRQFEILQRAQSLMLDIQDWQDFLKALYRAGYTSNSMITSENALLYAYVFYLVGKHDYGVPSHLLRDVIARWFFMSTLTARYSGSFETTMEQDLNRLPEVTTADAFVEHMDRIIDGTLTDDYWSITLPNALGISASRSPVLFAYYAALNVLGARALFSTLPVQTLLDPTIKAHKSAVERHHLFPRGYLTSLGVTETRDINQIANYALVEWNDNIAISDAPPAEYVPRYAARFTQDEMSEMAYWHALPNGWEQMDYDIFLEQRRGLMAGVIRDGLNKLAPTGTYNNLAK